VLVDELYLVDMASPVAMHDGPDVILLKPVGWGVFRQRDDIMFL
jgi:hypothetical protein